MNPALATIGRLRLNSYRSERKPSTLGMSDIPSTKTCKGHCNKWLWLVYFIFLLALGIIIQTTSGNISFRSLSTDWPKTFGGIFGSAFSLVLFPVVIFLVYLPCLMVKQRSFRVHTHFTTLLGILFVMSSIQAGLILFELLSRPRESSRPNYSNPQSVKDSYRFAPEFSDFEVTFSKQPKITDFQVGALMGKHAEASDSIIGCMQRAEVAPVALGTADRVTKDLAFQDLSGIVERNGFDHPEYGWGMSDLGPVATLRANKTLLHKGERISVTYQVKQYYGLSSVLAVTVAAPSADYPTPVAIQFFKSVKKRNK